MTLIILNEAAFRSGKSEILAALCLTASNQKYSLERNK